MRANFRHTFAGFTALAVACTGSEATSPDQRTRPAASALASVTLEPASTSMAVGETLTPTVILRDAAGVQIAAHAIAFSSSDERVLIVNDAGLVSALAKGEAVITATSGNKSGRMVVLVVAVSPPPPPAPPPPPPPPPPTPPPAPPPPPPAPPPPPPGVSPAWLWGMVVDDSGVCIPGALLTVTAGQGFGRSVVQTTPCDAWGYGAGFEFHDLTPGVAITLRATADGYVAQEKTFVPFSGSGPFTAVFFVLEPNK